MKLDKAQRTFCESEARYLRLLAPAGCGKTYALALRCLNISSQTKEKKQRFLVITFTRAAKEELRSRINSEPIFSPLRGCIDIVTLNQWGWRKLKLRVSNSKLITEKNDRHYCVSNDLKPIWEKHKVLNAVLNKQNNITTVIFDLMDGLKSIGFNHKTDTTLEKFRKKVLSFKKDGLTVKWINLVNQFSAITQREIPIDTEDDAYDKDVLSTVYENFFKFWIESVERLAETAKFTLEDQKYQQYLFEYDNLKKRKYLTGASSTNHLLIDEFQDINPLDLNLLKCIADRNRSTITIVGDDDQAIYEWRGATPNYILDPDQYFGHAFETHVLETNYRSPRNIVDLSQKLIANNTRRVKKKVTANQKIVAAIECIECNDINDGIQRVVQEHEEIRLAGDASARLAVIARKRGQILPIQVHLASQNIKFCAADDLQIFLSEAFENLIMLIDIKRGCRESQRQGKIIAETIKLCDVVKKHRVSKKEREELESFLQIRDPDCLFSAAEAIAEYDGSLKSDNSGRMSQSFSEKLVGFLDSTSVSDALMILANDFLGLQKDMGKAEEDVFFADPPFSHLAQYAQQYGANYDGFIKAMERAKATLAKSPKDDSMEFDLSTHEDHQRPVHLMTAPRSKGREFDTVVVLDANEGVWPCQQALSDDTRIEEERRLFYVAVTRPKKKLIFTVRSEQHANYTPPSRFLCEGGYPLPQPSRTPPAKSSNPYRSHPKKSH